MTTSRWRGGCRRALTRRRARARGSARAAVLAALVALGCAPAPRERPALVSVPLGAREARPVVIGVHGAGDRPEWACGGYRGALDAYPFIVCPAGRPCGGGKLCTSPPAELDRDLDEAVAALRARFGAHVAPGPMVLVGFSLGAIHGAERLRTRGRDYPRALLIEGATQQLTPAVARAFADAGGERILLLCAASSCAGSFDRARSALERVGVATRVVGAGTRRHKLDGEMSAVVGREWPWLVEGLASWTRPDR
ncbi:MAG TPA: hypothetical protein PLU22_02405 [Polyangiaceae bacterium]|nr:hypothetical protein [Polyangiaceae bacterium]